MIWVFLFFCLSSFAEEIVLRAKQILIPECPNAFNPSIAKFEENYLLAFRYCPDLENEEWVSYIGVVLLNDEFEQMSVVQLLSTRRTKTPSQSEDPRIFTYRGRTFLIFNDNMDEIFPSTVQRRDMYIAELFFEDGLFSLSTPLKLTHSTKYNEYWWQKNWFPFVWNSQLFLIYSINPHEILQPNLLNGICYPAYETDAAILWEWGKLRGGTPASLVDGEYLSFFHSSIYTDSNNSLEKGVWYYFMGAYTFSPDPPFTITKISQEPIVSFGFYSKTNQLKRVIYPGGFIDTESFIYVAYGKDDHEIWIATLDKNALLSSMKPVVPP